VARTLALSLLILSVFVATAVAASQRSAEVKARRAADRYTNIHFGIGGGASLWSARCSRAKSGWRCSVRLDSQCKGTLRLTSGLAAYRYSIGCIE
jgi:hypothetical protein